MHRLQDADSLQHDTFAATVFLPSEATAHADCTTHSMRSGSMTVHTCSGLYTDSPMVPCSLLTSRLVGVLLGLVLCELAFGHSQFLFQLLDDDVLVVDVLPVLVVLGHRFVQGRADTLEVREGDLRRRAL